MNIKHRWYCEDCKRELLEAEGPVHLWDTDHTVYYSFGGPQMKLTDFRRGSKN